MNLLQNRFVRKRLPQYKTVLRLGIIEHLYAQPLFHWLVERARGVSPPFELLRSRQTGTGTLALELRQKRLDGAFLSPIDYAKDYGMYRVVRGVGAVSRGDSNTIALLFNENLRGIETLAVDVASTSEIVLAHLILKEKYGVAPRIVPVSGLGEASLRKADAALLVGDVALAMRRKSNKIDLVDEWMDLTGLPYVHGFWVTREGGLTAPQTNYLIESAEAGKKNIESIVPPPELEYIGQFEYDLNDEALDSLGELFRMAYYHGILKDIPNMAFHRVGDEPLPPSVILN